MNEQINIYARNPVVTLVGGGVIGTAIGATAMYFYNKRGLNVLAEALHDLSVEHAELKDEQVRNRRMLATTVREAKEAVTNIEALGVTVLSNLDENMAPGDHPEIVIERVVQPTDEELAAFSFDASQVIGQVVDVQETDAGIEAEIELTEEGSELIRRNIFDDANDEWDYELERANRTPKDPYIIHADEFNGDEMGYDSQSTLTWYEADEILTDSNDTPIYNPHTVVGELKFGHGSGDANVVYIRNERLEAEYEVIREPGSYEKIVLGGASDIEARFEERDLRHSNKPLKFKE